MRLLLALLLALVLMGCASGPHTGNSLSADDGATLPTATPSGTSGGGSGGASVNLLQFLVSVNDGGALDGQNGLYAILINAFAEPIDVTNNDKFTDFVLWDGVNVTWYLRQTNPQNQSFVYVPVANLNQALAISADRRTFTVTFNVDDPSTPLNQFVVSANFTASVATTDRTPILGRILDGPGQGPSLNGNTLQTVTVNKFLGAIPPLPTQYPLDPFNDWVVQPDLNATFPYVNYDIRRFEITAR